MVLETVSHPDHFLIEIDPRFWKHPNQNMIVLVLQFSIRTGEQINKNENSFWKTTRSILDKFSFWFSKIGEGLDRSFAGKVFVSKNL